MLALHPTRRDLVLILAVVLFIALLLQFDFAQRIAGPSYSPEETRSKWLEDVKTGALSTEGRVVAGMSEARVRWTESSGPPETEVLAHAPGMSPTSPLSL